MSHAITHIIRLKNIYEDGEYSLERLLFDSHVLRVCVVLQRTTRRKMNITGINREIEQPVHLDSLVGKETSMVSATPGIVV